MRAGAQQALALLATSDWRGAVAELAEPIDPAESAVLGMAYLQGEDWAAAARALHDAVRLGDDTPITQLNLALAEDRLGVDGRARMQAVALQCPGWDEPVLRLAESLRRAGEHLDAIAQYERVLAINANRSEALLSLGILLLGQARVADARALLLRCCALSPRLADAWDALGIAAMAAQDFASAEAAFIEAQLLRPDSFEIALRRSEAALSSGTADAELARLAAATDADPLDVVQLTVRGVLLNRLGWPQDAAELLETAAMLAPDSLEALSALAESQINAGRHAQALPTLRRAVAHAPDNFAFRNNLAGTLNRLHQYREGRLVLEALVAECGERAEVLCNLCNSLVSLGLQHDGVAIARRAVAIAPEQNIAWRTLATSLGYCDGVPAAEVVAAWRGVGATVPRQDTPAPPRPTQPERRLRIGLLSTDMRTHPVGWLTIAAFEALDRTQFELVGFGGAPSDDIVQRRFRIITSDWHTIAGRPTRATAAAVREAGIDVLIDLGGWGDQSTLAVCAERPAPLQIKWVGSQSHSTGLAEIDWFVSDRWETPDGADALYTERLLRMPDGYVCYSPPPYAPELTMLPALARGFVTFGCFNNLAKITPPTIAVWSAIMARVPGSRLVLKTHQFSDKLTCDMVRARFAEHGIAAARLDLRGSSKHRSQLAQHGDVDIMLDPFPYTGGLTTCEALWMGVPVVTMPGETFASRHSTSHLSNVGLPAWIAADLRGYEQIAVAACADLPALAALRAGLRAHMQASPLCDAPRFADNLGRALRRIWRDACAG